MRQRVLIYACRKCHKAIKAPADLAGRPHRCPHCHGETYVPSEPGSRAVMAMIAVLVAIAMAGYAVSGWQAGLVAGMLCGLFVYQVVKQSGPRIGSVEVEEGIGPPADPSQRKERADPHSIKSDGRSTFRPKGFR